MEPKENQRPSARKRKKKRGGRRPGAGARRGKLNAFKHGRFSRYQQAFIEALMQVTETRETCPEPVGRSSRRVVIAISKRRRAQTTKRPNRKRPTICATATRKNSPIAIFFQNTTKSSLPKRADQPNTLTRIRTSYFAPRTSSDL